MYYNLSMSDEIDINLVERIYQNEKNIPEKVFLRQPVNREWREYTWKQTVNMARRLVSFFRDQGLKKGDKVSIFSKNCAEWYITDFAIAMAGLINVPIYATQQTKIINYILKEADVKLIFLGKLDTLDVQEPGIPRNIIRVNFPYDLTQKTDFQWDEIMKKYEPATEEIIPDQDDIFTLVYTSGTGANPKGVMLTYGNQTAVSKSMVKFIKESINLNKIKFLSYLPLAHIYERCLEATSCYLDIEISFAESIDTFAEDLKNVSPNLFAGVPRIWKLFKEKILEKVPQHKLDKLLKIPIISRLIKRKIQKALGLQNAFCLSGSAPLSVDTLEWFERLGMVIYEGYGATETFAANVVSYPGHRKVGTVGLPIFYLECKLSENNELLIRSKANMKGYYLNPEKTKEVIDEEGFYHTGDFAKIDEEGYVTITGRVNEVFKTDKAEFILPGPIENQCHQISHLSQLCLIGENLKQPILIAHLTEEAKMQPREFVRQSIFDAIQIINDKLTKWEKISHVIIGHDDWTIENGLLTPTLKIKRFVIAEQFHLLAEILQHKNYGVYWQDEIN